MSTTDIAQKLLIGSREIDRMKEEIKAVVGMVIGLVTDPDLVAWKRGFSTGMSDRAFYSPSCEWLIMPHAEYEYSISVECWTKKPNFPSSSKTKACAFSSAPHADLFLVSREARKVHAGLSVFVEGMIKTFPTLLDKLWPFLDAADHATRQA